MTDYTEGRAREGTLRRRFVALRTWLEGFPLSFLLLGLRVGVGAVFFRAGLLK